MLFLIDLYVYSAILPCIPPKYVFMTKYKCRC